MIHGQIKPLFNTPINWGHPLAQGLVASYLMNEGMGDLVHDSYGMNDGRTSGMAPMSPTSGWVPGPHGAALAFDGSNDTVTIPDFLEVGNNGTELTALVWCKCITPQNGTWALLHIGGAGNRAWGIYFPGGDGFGVRLYTDGAAIAKDYTKAGTHPAGLWRFTGMVFNAGLLSLYLDGAVITPSKNTDNACPSIYNSTAALAIGSSTANIMVSSVSIYNRALSAEEIAYLYAFPWCMYDRPASAWEYNQQNRNFDHYYRRLMAA
jgi:hypothetical protein